MVKTQTIDGNKDNRWKQRQSMETQTKYIYVTWFSWSIVPQDKDPNDLVIFCVNNHGSSGHQPIDFQLTRWKQRLCDGFTDGIHVKNENEKRRNRGKEEDESEVKQEKKSKRYRLVIGGGLLVSFTKTGYSTWREEKWNWLHPLFPSCIFSLSLSLSLVLLFVSQHPFTSLSLLSQFSSLSPSLLPIPSFLPSISWRCTTRRWKEKMW